MDVDFIIVDLPEAHIYYLVPGQIHHNIKKYDSDTWFLSVNPSLVAKLYREVSMGTCYYSSQLNSNNQCRGEFGGDAVYRFINACFKYRVAVVFLYNKQA
jgi:hypothetical protein